MIFANFGQTNPMLEVPEVYGSIGRREHSFKEGYVLSLETSGVGKEVKEHIS